MPRYVAGFLICGDEVLLIQKLKPSWQRGRWNGVGGHVEDGEGAIDAMIREMKEETDIDIPIEELEHFCTLTGDDFEVVFFRAFVLTTCGQQTTDEIIGWFNINNLPNVIPNLKWLVPMAVNEQVGRGMPYYIREA